MLQKIQIAFLVIEASYVVKVNSAKNPVESKGSKIRKRRRTKRKISMELLRSKISEDVVSYFHEETGMKG